ncbi:flagellar M-ring protein FliF [Desulfitispora alkaliphila]|uniref:flagellar basal-body MS-ring/collar protein FliF n=1 Tax=Desulfitispora alkaliphila TaxID=622674 RepID=UPI003D22080B
MVYWRQIQEQVLTKWRQMNTAQKVAVSSSVVIVIITMIFLGRMATKPDYSPLFTNLNHNDAGAIAARLDDMRVPYELADGGRTILVPQREKHQLRIQLANEDLPRGGVVGFESFNESRFGETETDKRIRMLVALQGELTRTIESMAEIESARVHIVIPEERLFNVEDKTATASIMINLKPYSNLRENQVLGIMRLVANSVEHLSSDQVTVIDTSGNILSEGLGSGESDSSTYRLTSNQIEIKEKLEENMSRSIQTMLERALGSGRAVVRVSADLNFDEVERRSERFGDNVIRSEQLIEETSSSENMPGAGGPAGIDPNDGTIAGVDETATSEYDRREQIRNFEIDREEEYIRVSPGTVNNMSVSVIVDTSGWDDFGAMDEERIRNIVASAAGIQVAGVETGNPGWVEVIGMDFDTTAMDSMLAQMEEYERQQFIRQMITYGVLALAALIFAFFGYRAIKKKMAENEVSREIEEVVPKEQISPEDKEKDLLKRQVEDLAKDKPEDVAKLLKTWLSDD